MILLAPASKLDAPSIFLFPLTIKLTEIGQGRNQIQQLHPRALMSPVILNRRAKSCTFNCRHAHLMSGFAEQIFSISEWTLADCDWRAVALGLKALRLPRDQKTMGLEGRRNCGWVVVIFLARIKFQ